MATAAETVTKALRSLRVLPSGVDPTAEEAADGLDALNEMLFAWRIDGIDIAHIELAGVDTIDVPDDHLQTLRLALAERLGGEFGAQLTPADQIALAKGMAALTAYYFNIADLDSENPLSDRNLANDW